MKGGAATVCVRHRLPNFLESGDPEDHAKR